MYTLLCYSFTYDCKGCCGSVDYRGDHAVVLFPGSTAAEECDEESQKTHHDEDNGACRGVDVHDPKGFVHRNLHDDSHDNQCKSTKL